MSTQRRIDVAYEPVEEVVTRFRPQNPKKHDRERIARSILELGYVTPVLVNETDGLLVEGQGRAEAVLELQRSGTAPPDGVKVLDDGRWTIPVVRGVELTPEQARQYTIAANRLSEIGGWDLELLLVELEAISAFPGGIALTGFDETSLVALATELDRVGVPTVKDPDEIDPLPSATTVALGQVFQLGRHLVLCGDATDRAAVERLVADRRPALGVLDPPFNVALGKRSPRRHRTIANDDLAPEAMQKFTKAWAETLMSLVDGACYVFLASKEIPTVMAELEGAGGHWSSTLVWVKDRFVLGRADYHQQFEPIWYGWRDGGPHYWSGARDQSNTWWYPRPARSDVHPTMKPIALLQRAIQNSSRPGERVLDLFLGSGSTLIASEIEGRDCVGVELDPLYVQATIDRWQKLTGRTAIRVA